MYNKYPYMSDMYLIPKTCTRTCLFLEYPGVMIRSVLKIDMGRWESHPGPSVSVMTGAATPRLLVVETFPSQNLTVVEIQYGNLSLNSLRFFWFRNHGENTAEISIVTLRLEATGVRRVSVTIDKPDSRWDVSLPP